MEFGPYQLQIAVSAALVLSAAVVALIVDYLKGNNEQLRELAVELRVRHVEELGRAQTVLPRPKMASVPAPLKPAAKIEKQEPQEKRVDTPAARSLAAPKERKRMPSPDALAAMERGAQLAASPRAQSPAAQRIAKAAAETKPKAQKKDWDSLLSRRSRTVATPAPANPDLLQAIVAETSTPRSKENNDLPSGFHAGFQDGYILSHLVQSRRPVSGLVVSIGVNTPRNADGSMPEPVCALIQSLIGPDDFACQSSEEEFLLIYPSQRGASAQRKLSQIAQQLWDFQLRSLGTFSILFSWGGVEVRSESMEEAISAANERMQQTRRSRKLLTIGSPGQMPLRQAV